MTTRSPTSSPDFLNGDPRMMEFNRPGGLFDEFLQLQPSQLSWGGVITVICSLITSHRQSLSRLQSIESSVMDLKASIEKGPRFDHGGSHDVQRQLEDLRMTQEGVSRRVEAIDTNLQVTRDQVERGTRMESALDSKAARAQHDIDQLYSVLQLSKVDAERAVSQSAAEGVGSHACVKLMHCLPAFSTLIDDIRDVLSGGSIQPAPPAPPKVPNPMPSSPSTSTRTHHVSSQMHAPPMTGLAGISSMSHASAAPPSGGRPMVGLEIIDAVPDSGDPLASSGVRVFAVRPDGPAAKAGVQDGDCILALNGRPVTTRADLKEVMAGCAAGEVVTVDLLREGVPDAFQVHIKLGSSAAPPLPMTTTSSTISPRRSRPKTPTRR